MERCTGGTDLNQEVLPTQFLSQIHATTLDPTEK